MVGCSPTKQSSPAPLSDTFFVADRGAFLFGGDGISHSRFGLHWVARGPLTSLESFKLLVLNGLYSLCRYNKLCYILGISVDDKGSKANPMTGQNLKEARQKAGWTQQQAASALGVTQAYLSMVERGHRPVTDSVA